MKKTLTILLVAGLVTITMAGKRMITGQPNGSDVLSITITEPSQLQSVICDVTASGETNSFTITADVIAYSNRVAVSTNTYTYATAVADQIAGAETVQLYTNAMVLKTGSILKFTGNDGTQTDNTNVWYYAVLNTFDD